MQSSLVYTPSTLQLNNMARFQYITYWRTLRSWSSFLSFLTINAFLPLKKQSVQKSSVNTQAISVVYFFSIIMFTWGPLYPCFPSKPFWPGCPRLPCFQMTTNLCLVKVFSRDLTDSNILEFILFKIYFFFTTSCYG